MVDRLAAYEDTGLEPEEVMQIKPLIKLKPYRTFQEVKAMSYYYNLAGQRFELPERSLEPPAAVAEGWEQDRDLH